MTTRVLKPGRYGLSRLRVGDRIETGTMTVSAQAIDAFAALSGDRFEIHMSDDAAQRHGFPGRVAHGLLVLSLVDGLKNQAPAQFDAVASLGWEWHFTSPVFVGDVLSVTITVTGLRPTSDGRRGIATLEFDVRNLHGRTVQRGTNRLMIYS